MIHLHRSVTHWLVVALTLGAVDAARAAGPAPLAAEGTMAAGPIARIDARSMTSGGIFTGLVLHDDAHQTLVVIDPDLAADDAGVLTGFVEATVMTADGAPRHASIPVNGHLRLNDTLLVKMGAGATSTTTATWTHAAAFTGLGELDGGEEWTLSVNGRSRGRASGTAVAEPTWQWQMTLRSTAGWQATGAATLTMEAGTQAGFYATPQEWTPRTPDLAQWQGDAVLVTGGEDARDGGRSRLALTFAEAEAGEFVLRCAQGSARVRQSGTVTTTAEQAVYAWGVRQMGPEAFNLLPRHVLFTTPGSSSRVVLEWDEAYWK